MLLILLVATVATCVGVVVKSPAPSLSVWRVFHDACVLVVVVVRVCDVAVILLCGYVAMQLVLSAPLLLSWAAATCSWRT